mmetsp:Transcript_20416/g.32854  ORF Transcript_20416/g.32854 Transcript_20416/m.32854 type:complete len:202 (+) Transcript_20416:277-882(+)
MQSYLSQNFLLRAKITIHLLFHCCCRSLSLRRPTMPKQIKVNPAERKVLNVLAARKAKFDEESVEKSKLAGYAQIGGSTMRKAVARLSKEGLIVQVPKSVSITKAGMDHADPDAIEMPISNDAHQAAIKANLKEKEVNLVEFLQDGFSKDKKEVAEAIGMEMNSTWRKMIAKLAKENIIEHSGKTIRLHKDMFPIIPRPEE